MTNPPDKHDQAAAICDDCKLEAATIVVGRRRRNNDWPDSPFYKKVCDKCVRKILASSASENSTYGYVIFTNPIQKGES